MTQPKAHFIGISGKGMSAVAKLLKDKGYTISGSDDGFYPPVSDYLRRHGLPLTEGYRAENIPADADVVVIGKNAKLVPDSNAEVAAAFAKNVSVQSFPEVLTRLIEQTHNIVVAGSFGKSSVSALLAWCLLQSGTDPSFFVGEIVRGMDEHARLGNGPVFVLEGDEYPSANWDDTSKFLYYRPRDLLLTAVIHDHVNVFPTQAAFEVPFRKLVGLLPASGVLVACADEAHARRLAAEAPCPVVLYGLDAEDALWSAADVRFEETTRFVLTRAGQPVVDLSTGMLGRHSVQNIVGAAALLLERRLLTPAAIQAAVAAFQGVKRRMELLTTASRVPVYEGFGSSYDKAVSAFEAIALHFPGRRVVTVFEPHTFSWRSRDKISWYDDVFAPAALALIYAPASQGAATHAQLSHAEIVDRIAAAGTDARAVTTPKDTLSLLDQELRDGDVVLILTSGGLDGMIASIPVFVEAKFPR